jgi:hypothetical protein
MAQTMTDKKYWFRKSDGALVRPTMREPSTLENEDDWNIWSWNIWRKHLSSLPALTNIVIDPEYAKTLKDGWVKVERVRWEIGYFPHPDEPMKWVPCTEKEYNEGYLVMVDVRLVLLAPVEKVEDNLTIDFLTRLATDELNKMDKSNFGQIRKIVVGILKKISASGSEEKDKEIERLRKLIDKAHITGWMDALESKYRYHHEAIAAFNKKHNL